MKAQNQGLIVNMASIGGLIAHSQNVTPYVASKHAVIGFSRGLSKDLEGTDIRVLAVCPHLTDTEFFAVSPGAEEMAPQLEKYKTFMDSPEDVAAGVLNQLDSERLVVFPTEKPAKAYAKAKGSLIFMKTEDTKTALVIGGGSGMGRSAAVSLGDLGIQVFVADLDMEAAGETASDIREKKGRQRPSR